MVDRARSTMGAAILLLSALLAAGAGEAADKFGQDVSPALEERLQQARILRLPYTSSYDPQKSIELLKSVIADKDDYYRAYFNLGLAYNEVGQYKNAVEAFERALEIKNTLNIDDATIYNSYGWVALKNNDFQTAEKYLRQAESETKGSGSFTEGAVISNLGELYFLTQRFEEAVPYLTISRDKYDNEFAEFYLNIIASVRDKAVR